VKWLRRIKVVNEPYMGMWESTKYPSLRMDGLSRWFQFRNGSTIGDYAPFRRGKNCPAQGSMRSAAWRGRAGA